MTGLAVGWLIAGLLRISRYGPSSGIGCYVLHSDGSRGKLIGGLRMRLERGRRKLLIAGLLVEPQWRSAGIGTALILAAFRLAQKEAAFGSVTVAVFAPSHPASKAIIAKQLGGMQTVMVSVPPSETLRGAIERLTEVLQRSNSKFQWHLGDSEARLFDIPSTAESRW